MLCEASGPYSLCATLLSNGNSSMCLLLSSHTPLSGFDSSRARFLVHRRHNRGVLALLLPLLDTVKNDACSGESGLQLIGGNLRGDSAAFGIKHRPLLCSRLA
ncbi:hypothetical protein IAD21_01207 [Abditibacteriota bacterium]|nr:hypothetical protein IAD21_01207 [Abditibacteriota bacterium]